MEIAINVLVFALGLFSIIGWGCVFLVWFILWVESFYEQEEIPLDSSGDLTTVIVFIDLTNSVYPNTRLFSFYYKRYDIFIEYDGAQSWVNNEDFLTDAYQDGKLDPIAKSCLSLIPVEFYSEATDEI